MNLLVIEPGLKLWGSERALLATVDELRRAHDEVVFAVDPGAELGDLLSDGRAIVEHGPIANLHRKGLPARLRALVALVRIARRWRPDVIYLNQAGLCRIVHVVARLLRRPLVIHVRLLDDVPRCAALKATSAAPVTLIFVSEDLRRRYEALNDAEHLKTLVTAYDAVDASSYPPPAAAPLASFACLGRLEEGKGQSRLVEALALAAPCLPQPLNADLIGAVSEGDPYVRAVQARIGEAGLSRSIRLLGYRADAPDLLSNYRFLVVCSTYESFGRTVVEGWIGGALPIVPSESGGAAELVERSGGGLLYDGRSPAGLAEVLCAAAAMPEPERRRVVEAGRSWARRRLSLAAYRESLAGILFPAAPNREPTRAELSLPA